MHKTASQIAKQVLNKLAQYQPQPSVPDPVAEFPEEQRKQDLHEQQMQFAEEKHILELERLRQKVTQDDQAFQTKQTSAMNQMPQSPTPQMMQQQQRMNIMQGGTKSAEVQYDQYGRPIIPPSPALSMGVGAAGGGALGHIYANPETLNLRAELAKLAPEAARTSPLAAKAFRSGLNRTAGGAALGALGGYLFNRFTS